MLRLAQLSSRRRRVTQYSRGSCDERLSRGVLGPPPSRRTTIPMRQQLIKAAAVRVAAFYFAWGCFRDLRGARRSAFTGDLRMGGAKRYPTFRPRAPVLWVSRTLSSGGVRATRWLHPYGTTGGCINSAVAASSHSLVASSLSCGRAGAVTCSLVIVEPLQLRRISIVASIRRRSIGARVSVSKAWSPAFGARYVGADDELEILDADAVGVGLVVAGLVRRRSCRASAAAGVSVSRSAAGPSCTER